MGDIMSYNGGAVLAMTGKNCVAIASDLRFGVQAQTIGMNFSKIVPINDTVFAGFSGLATDIQTLAELLTFQCNVYRLREERDIQPKTFAHLLSSVLYEKRFGPYFSEPIVAGLSNDGRPYVCTMDLLGTITETKDFVAAGTCTEALMGTSESLYRPDLEADELVDVISQCFVAALNRDAVSGWGAVVKIITAAGVRTVDIKMRMD
ncbi:hypothetical protein RCL1_001749 [Eukaryota sp. TZLM3-RCL]